MLATTAVVLGIGISACGSGPPASVASLGSSSSTSTSAPVASPGRSSSTQYNKILTYAVCMRAHGEPNYPDPGVSTIDGRQIISFPAPNTKGGDLNLGSPAGRAAEKACMADYNAIGSAQSKAQIAQNEKDGLAFARCMRAHGIADWPDPVFDSLGHTTGTLPKDVTSEPGYFKSQTLCNEQNQ